MNAGQTVFAQVIAFASHNAFNRCVHRCAVGRAPRRFSYWDQFLAMTFAQLTYRESLRDLEARLSAVPEKLYHLGFRGRVTRSTLADANERRDWRMFAQFAQILIAEGRQLYSDDATDGSVHDVRVLDVLIPEPGSIYVFDRAYVDFARLWRLHESRAVFVTRAMKNL